MEKFDLENFPTSESAKKMLSYVSDGFYDESYVGKWLFQVMGIEYDKALEIVTDLPSQFFPETATWGLMYHEIKWGLPVRLNLSYEERRRLIYQKRDYRAPMTPYRMEKCLEDATGFEVHIADVNDPGEYGFIPPHPNVFKAYFLGEGSLDSKVAFEILNRLKQSHTTYTINDRIEVELDNRNLEHIILRNILFKIGISFWYDYVYDGSWLLNGSVIFDTKRRYGLGFGMKYNMAIPFWCEYMYDGNWLLDGIVMLNTDRSYNVVLSIKHKFGIVAFQAMAELRIVAFRFSIDFWRLLYLNGGWNLDGEQMFDYGRGKTKAAFGVRSEMDFSKRETVAAVSVVIKTWDYWFLDGTMSLNGVRSLNSIYRKEEVG